MSEKFAKRTGQRFHVFDLSRLYEKAKYLATPFSAFFYLIQLFVLTKQKNNDSLCGGLNIWPKNEQCSRQNHYKA